MISTTHDKGIVPSHSKKSYSLVFLKTCSILNVLDTSAINTYLHFIKFSEYKQEFGRYK